MSLVSLERVVCTCVFNRDTAPSICICNAIPDGAVPKYSLDCPNAEYKHDTTHHQPADRTDKLHRSCATAGPHHVRTALRYGTRRRQPDTNERIDIYSYIGGRRAQAPSRVTIPWRVFALLSRVIISLLSYRWPNITSISSRSFPSAFRPATQSSQLPEDLLSSQGPIVSLSPFAYFWPRTASSHFPH